jgi:hypothetical protein
MFWSRVFIPRKRSCISFLLEKVFQIDGIIGISVKSFDMNHDGNRNFRKDQNKVSKKIAVSKKS